MTLVTPKAVSSTRYVVTAKRGEVIISDLIFSQSGYDAGIASSDATRTVLSCSKVPAVMALKGSEMAHTMRKARISGWPAAAFLLWQGMQGEVWGERRWHG